MLFTCIKSWFFRNHLANFHQISHWSFCWNVIDSLFKWSCSIDCQANIFFFKTKNCSNDDIFISCDDRIGKMLHNICISAVAMSLRWANRGPWASCFVLFFFFVVFLLLFFAVFFFVDLCQKLLFWVYQIKYFFSDDYFNNSKLCFVQMLLAMAKKNKNIWWSLRYWDREAWGNECRPRLDAADCVVWSGSTVFATHLAVPRHSSR